MSALAKTLAAASGLLALAGTVTIMHGLTAEPALPSAPSDAERCLREYWHIADKPVRDAVVRQCLQLLEGGR